MIQVDHPDADQSGFYLDEEVINDARSCSFKEDGMIKVKTISTIRYIKTHFSYTKVADQPEGNTGDHVISGREGAMIKVLCLNKLNRLFGQVDMFSSSRYV